MTKIMKTKIKRRSDYDTPWVIKFGRNLDNFNTPFLPENISSPHQLTLERPEGVAVVPLSL